jgi:O-antigen ligase
MRIYIPFGDQQWGSSSYSSVLAIIYPLVFYTAFTHIKTRLAQFSILFLIVAAIFALDGRTGYIVFIILSLASLCFISSHNSFDKMKAIGLSMMANIAGVIVGLYASKIKIGEVAFNDRVTSIDLERPASGRLDIWQGSFQQFFDHPWIGIGVDGYRELNIMQDVEKHVLHPHNIILELLVDTGIIGLVAFIIVIGVVTFKYLAAYVRYHGNLKSLYAYVFLMFVGYGMASMALTSIFRSWWYLYLIMILILLAISTKQMKKFVNINEQ